MLPGTESESAASNLPPNEGMAWIPFGASSFARACTQTLGMSSLSANAVRRVVTRVFP